MDQGDSMPEPETVKMDARLPTDLVERAAERARRIQPDAQISGILRYALALLAGLPPDQAREHLKIRPKGYSRTARNRT